MDNYESLLRSMEKQLETANRTFEQTKEMAGHVLNRVEKTTGEWQTLRKHMKRMLYVIFSVIITIFGIIGIKTIPDLVSKYKDIGKEYVEMKASAKEIKTNASYIHAVRLEAENNIEKLKKNIDETKSLRQIVLGIRKLSKDIKLDEDIDLNNEDQLKEISINFGFLKALLFGKYISKHEKYNYEVVFEAIKTCLKLEEQNYLKFSDNRRKTLIKATKYVMKSSADGDWRTSLKARTIYIDLFKDLSAEYRISEIKDMQVRLLSESKLKFRWIIALILADLKESNYLRKSDPNAIKILTEIAEKPDNEWVESSSAVALVKIGDDKGWDVLSNTIQKGGRDAYVASFLLGQLGRKRLKKLGIEKLKITSDPDKLAFLADLLESNIHDSDMDYYSKLYLDIIIKKIRIHSNN